MAAPSPLAALVDDAGQSSRSQFRIGQVVGYNAGVVAVRFAGGDTDEFPFVRSYLPVLGETVILAAIGSAWVVMAGIAGIPPDNPVGNASFEDSAPGAGNPSGWGKWTASGASSYSVQNITDGFEVDRRQVFWALTSGTNSNTSLYSSPIPVQPGEVWTANAMVVAGTAPGDQLTCSLRMSWHAALADVPPTYVSLTQVATQDFQGILPFWYVLRGGGATGGVVAPAGANYMRIVLNTVNAVVGGGSSSAYWDRVVAYKLS